MSEGAFLILKLAKVTDMFWFYGELVKIFSVHILDIVGGVLSNSNHLQGYNHILLNTYNHSFLYKRKEDHLEKGLSPSIQISSLVLLSHSLNLVLSCCLTNLALRASTVNPKVGHGGDEFLFGISNSQVHGHNLV